MVSAQERIDICVNNAGMVSVGSGIDDAPVWATSLDTWNRSLERNLTTCFLVTRAVLPVMRASGYGRVVNIASTSGTISAYPGDVAYHSAKAGMTGFTKAVALETAADGITVNAVAPGWIATGSQTEAEAAAGAATPVGRSGRADEIATIVRLLADTNCSYVTGQTIVVDGGNCLPEVHR